MAVDPEQWDGEVDDCGISHRVYKTIQLPDCVFMACDGDDEWITEYVQKWLLDEDEIEITDYAY